MRTVTVAGVRVAAVALLFWLFIQGPDYLLATVLDVELWGAIGLGTGLLTLPLLWRVGVGFLPPWTTPALVGDDRDLSLPRVSLYHLCGTVLGAWLWTQPTRRAVAWVHDLRGLPPASGGAVPLDPVSVAVGLLVAELLLFVAALVAFVRTATFGTVVDLTTVDARVLLGPGVAGIGATLLVGFVVTLLSVVAATAGIVTW